MPSKTRSPRIDVAFAESAELEHNALRALFGVYADLRQYDRLTPKIFLRSDIWERITAEGFREASHITRAITISWDNNALMNLMVSRLKIRLSKGRDKRWATTRSCDS